MHYPIQILLIIIITIIGEAHGVIIGDFEYIGGTSRGGVINASVIMEKIELGEPVHCVSKTIQGNLDIRDLNLKMVTRTMGSRENSSPFSPGGELKIVESVVDMQSCLIMGNVDFSNARFLDSISFSGCTFTGDTNFLGSQFNKWSSFDSCQFDQYTNFVLSGFGKLASFRFSRFEQFASFDSCQFDSSAVFNECKFGERAGFSGVQFNQSADFSDSHFNQSADFSYSHFNQSADFNRATFSGDLSFESSWIDSLNLKDAEFSKIVLKSWKSIHHMEYDEMAYQLLISNFRNRNLPEVANDCYYDYRNDRRATLSWYYQPVDISGSRDITEVLTEVLNRATRSLLYQPVDYALMLFYGYGVKPDRPVIWSFVFIALFAALFWWRQGILPVRKGEPEEEANRFSLLEAAAFSAMTFLSGGKLVFDPPEYRIAPGRPWRDVQISKALFILERLLGMVLIIMFAIAVGKTIIMGGG